MDCNCELSCEKKNPSLPIASTRRLFNSVNTAATGCSFVGSARASRSLINRPVTFRIIVEQDAHKQLKVGTKKRFHIAVQFKTVDKPPLSDHNGKNYFL